MKSHEENLGKGVDNEDVRPKKQCPRCDGSSQIYGRDFDEHADGIPWNCEPDLGYNCPRCEGHGYVEILPANTELSHDAKRRCDH